MTYFARRRHDVVVEESFDLVRLDLPQQALDLQLNLPLAVNTYGDHNGAEEHEAEDSGDEHRQQVAVVFRAVLVLEAALWLIGRDGAALGPVNAHDVVEFVFLGIKVD